jgi:O-antigen/teichoic acid export membrane protein
MIKRWSPKAASILSIAVGRGSIAGAISALLRLASLVSKLGLVLYMGRYLSLSDMGVYGLVFGAVMILTTIVGIRFDYVVSRDLVRATPQVALAKMRDQTVFSLANYGVAALILAAAWEASVTSIAPRLLLYIFVLTITDNYANLTYVNMNSMERPLRANALYFISGGLWCFVAVGLGLVFPNFRDVDTVLTAWIVGNFAFFCATFWSWRALPWRQVRAIPIDWSWIKRGVKTSSLIWLGTVGLAIGTYVDRFIVVRFLDLEKVGIATFYFSFANAMLTLVHSGVLAFAYPRLVALYRDRDVKRFREEMWKTIKYVALSAAGIGAAIGVTVPLLGLLFDRPQYADYASVLWLILLAMWLRANADTLYQVLFARHQDRAIWLGDLLYLLPALASNVVLVPLLGLSGIGYAAILSALFLFSWRAWHLKAIPF